MSDDFLIEVMKFADAGRMTMTAMFEDNSEFTPQVLIIPKNDGEKTIIGTMAGIEAGGLKDALISVLSSPGIPVPKVIVLTVDTYAMLAKLPADATVKDADDLRIKYAGKLGHYFAQGDPRITEAMNVIVITEERTGLVIQRYRKTASDGLEWDEPEYSGEPTGWNYDDVVGATQDTYDSPPKKYPVCPHCGGYIPNDEHPGEYVGALSRRDNKTEICSACGVREGMEDFMSFLDAKKESE